ncbi:serine/arginine repetitive matrix protein 1-like [Prionailurus bengalensis]|uniref:serine/arginine repetitive matrix protein 1-like n=1 Tax=Prionailurus bengalensis TaxID=37029 RepID=UPI001CA80E5A|nr:serine/arginine repetitive matrix protein 1-like [Prionailurus bengalensis]
MKGTSTDRLVVARRWHQQLVANGDKESFWAKIKHNTDSVTVRFTWTIWTIQSAKSVVSEIKVTLRPHYSDYSARALPRSLLASGPTPSDSSESETPFLEIIHVEHLGPGWDTALPQRLGNAFVPGLPGNPPTLRRQSASPRPVPRRRGQRSPGCSPTWSPERPRATEIRGLRPRAEQAGQSAPCGRGLGPLHVPPPLSVAHGPARPLLPLANGIRQPLFAVAGAPGRGCSRATPAALRERAGVGGTALPVSWPRGARNCRSRRSESQDRARHPALGSPRLPIAPRDPARHSPPARGANPARTRAGGRPMLPPRAHTQPPAAARTAGRAQTTRRGPGVRCSLARSHARTHARALSPSELGPTRPAALRTPWVWALSHLAITLRSEHAAVRRRMYSHCNSEGNLHNVWSP